MQNTTLDTLMTSEEVAGHLGITVAGLWKWVREGTFPEPDIHRPKFSRYLAATVQRWQASGGGIGDFPHGKPATRTVVPEAPRSARARVATPSTAKASPAGNGARPHKVYTDADKRVAVKRYAKEVVRDKTTSASKLAKELGVPKATMVSWYTASRG